MQEKKLVYNLKLLPKTEIQIIDPAYYYESKQIGLGEAFLANLKLYLTKITETPYLFEQKRPPYREAYVQKFPFLIIYSIQDSEIVVADVFHTSQNPIKKPNK